MTQLDFDILYLFKDHAGFDKFSGITFLHHLPIYPGLFLASFENVSSFSSSAPDDFFSFSSFFSHVVGHVDGVELVGEEAVPQMHPLLLAPRVDGDGAGVGDDRDPHDQVVLLLMKISHPIIKCVAIELLDQSLVHYQDSVGDEGHEVQCLVLGAVELRHHHEQVGPREDGTEDKKVKIGVKGHDFTKPTPANFGNKLASMNLGSSRRNHEERIWP